MIAAVVAMRMFSRESDSLRSSPCDPIVLPPLVVMQPPSLSGQPRIPGTSRYGSSIAGAYEDPVALPTLPHGRTLSLSMQQAQGSRPCGVQIRRNLGEVIK